MLLSIDGCQASCKQQAMEMLAIFGIVYIHQAESAQSPPKQYPEKVSPVEKAGQSRIPRVNNLENFDSSEGRLR